MPIVNDDDEVVNDDASASSESAQGVPNPEDKGLEEDSYSNSEVIMAHVRQSNSAYQAYKAAKLGRLSTGIKGYNLTVLSKNYDEEQLAAKNFNLKEELDVREIPDEEREFFANVKTPKQLSVAMDYYQQDQKDKEIISNTSIARNLALGVVAGATDPINYIPVARALKFGSTAVRAAVEGVVVGGASYTLRAAANNDFEVEDLAIDSVAGGVTAGIFSGALKGISSLPKLEAFKSFKSAIKDMMDTSRWFEMEDGVLKEVSVGKFGTVKKKAKRTVWKMLENSPMWQMYNSGDPLLKDLSWRLFRSRISNLKPDKGVVPITAEEGLNAHIRNEMVLSEKVNSLRDQFIQSSGGSVADFNNKVGLEIVNSYVERTSQHPTGTIVLAGTTNDKHVLEAAEEVLKYQHNIILNAEKYGVLAEGFDSAPIKTSRYVVDEALWERGVFTGSKETAKGHISRKYDSKSIIENSETIKKLLEKEIEINEGNVSANTLAASISGNKIDLSHAVWNEVTSKGSVVKDREIAISDAVLLKEGFLDYDPVTNHSEQFRAIAAQTELNRVAKEMGYEHWDALKKQAFVDIPEEKIGELVLKGDKLPNAEQVIEANRDNYQYNFNLLNNVELAFKGQLNKTGLLANNQVIRWIHDTKAWQFVAMSGQMMLSCTLDASQLVLRHNFGRGMKRMFSDMAKGAYNTSVDLLALGLDKAHMENVAKGLREFKLKYTKDQIDEAFGFLDQACMRNRFADLASISATNTEKLGDRVSRFASEYTGMDLVIKSLKKSAAEGEYSHLIKECLKGEHANRQYLNKMGISEDFQRSIAEGFNRAGTKESGIYYVDPTMFKQDLQDQLQASIQSIADQTISTAGIGDAPLFLRTAAGSLFFMFKSYPFLIYNNFIRPAMRHDISKSTAAAAVAASISLSAARLFVKNTVNGYETDPTSSDFWKEVLEYSNINTYIIENSLLLYDKTFNRKYNDDVASSISVPLAMFNRICKTVAGLATGDANLRSVRNMTPGLNFWWARPLTNPLLPKPRRKRKYNPNW